MDKIITVFGGCGWDKTFKDGIISEAPGSKGSNQAVAAARAGAKVHIISLVGDDETGKKIIKNLEKEGVNTERIEILKGVASDCAFIRIDEFGDNHIERAPNSAIGYYTTDLIDKNAELLKNSDIVIAQTKVPKNVTEYLINFCYKNNIDLILTPCSPDKFNPIEKENINLLKKVKTITANEKEALKITGAQNIEEALRILPNMIVTRGPDGVSYSNGKIIKNIKALPTNVVDTTGAGDTLCGNFAASTLSGKYDFAVCIKRGIIASTIKIGHKGAQLGMPTAEKVNEELLKRDFVTHCDLHTHTIHSDGGFSAIDVVQFAITDKISPFSITDHDSVDGYFELADKKFNDKSIQIFTGTELSFSYNGIYAEVLGYGFDIEKMREWLKIKYSQEKKVLSQQNILNNAIKKYKEMGVIFNTELNISSGNKSAAYQMLKTNIYTYKENKENFPELFEQDFYRTHFSNPKSKYFVDETFFIPSCKETVNAIHEYGGLAMLAHPGAYGFSESELNSFLEFAVSNGVDGFELRYPKNSSFDRKIISAVADKYNLLLSGGSDFHGKNIKESYQLAKLHPNKEVDASFIIDFERAVVERTFQANKPLVSILEKIKNNNTKNFFRQR